MNREIKNQDSRVAWRNIWRLTLKIVGIGALIPIFSYGIFSWPLPIPRRIDFGVCLFFLAISYWCWLLLAEKEISSVTGWHKFSRIGFIAGAVIGIIFSIWLLLALDGPGWVFSVLLAVVFWLVLKRTVFTKAKSL